MVALEAVAITPRAFHVVAREETTELVTFHVVDRVDAATGVRTSHVVETEFDTGVVPAPKS